MEADDDQGGAPPARLRAVVLDTDEPARLAAFYAELLGWPVTYADEAWVSIGGPGGVTLSFQLTISHRPPTWPANDIPQQFHLDLTVDDLPAASAAAERLGARRVPGAGSRTVVVFTDPSGHPFCLVAAPA